MPELSPETNIASSAEDITVLGGRVKLTQPESGFKTCIDSVLLAAACPAKPGEAILDLGCGVGGAGLCVLARIRDTTLCGIDIQTDHIALAKQNAALNGFENQTEFYTLDVQSLLPNADDKGLALIGSNRFDHVICNPPFMQEGTHHTSPDPSKATAHTMALDLEIWTRAAFAALSGRGSLTMIHRADHTDAIIRALGKMFGSIDIIPLLPRAGIPPKRVLIRAYKHRKSPCTLHLGIPVHNDEGRDYTPEMQKILRDGHAIL